MRRPLALRAEVLHRLDESVPKYICQNRFTVTRAVSGFDGITSHRARPRRLLGTSAAAEATLRARRETPSRRGGRRSHGSSRNVSFGVGRLLHHHDGRNPSTNASRFPREPSPGAFHASRIGAIRAERKETPAAFCCSPGVRFAAGIAAISLGIRSVASIVTSSSARAPGRITRTSLDSPGTEVRIHPRRRSQRLLRREVLVNGIEDNFERLRLAVYIDPDARGHARAVVRHRDVMPAGQGSRSWSRCASSHRACA